MKHRSYTPTKLYTSWMILYLVVALLIIDGAFQSSSQVGLVLIMYSLMALVIGTFLISLLNMYLFKEWFKRFWKLNALITISTGALIGYFIFRALRYS